VQLFTFHIHSTMLFRLLICTAVPAAAAELSVDGTESATMLQVGGASTGKGRSTGKVARTGQAAGLYASTLKMLREGATPEVVTFSEEAVKDIQTTVYAAMDAEHKRDQDELLREHATFDTIRKKYMEDAQKIVGSLTALVTADKTAHDSCRSEEEKKCDKYHDEEEKRKTLWQSFKSADAEFEAKTDEQQWCGDAETDMEAQHTKFQSYEAAGKTRFEAWDSHESQRVTALASLHELEEQSTTCRTKQAQFERSSCNRFADWQTAKLIMESTWNAATETYNSMVDSVKQKTGDRNAEYSTLEEVKCLLSDIKERGGKPCEEQADGTSEEADKVMESCRKEIDPPKYIIEYPDVGASPELVAEPPKPCDENFEAAEYGSYKSNTKCFENFPECVPCADLTATIEE
jgi:hypothetical protein